MKTSRVGSRAPAVAKMKLLLALENAFSRELCGIGFLLSGGPRHTSDNIWPSGQGPRSTQNHNTIACVMCCCHCRIL